MADFSQNQKLFASALAASSGLDPRTVETWMAAEEPIGASSGYKGTQDWLNVGITDSGPMGQGNSVWKDPVAAGQFTGKWLKGQVSDPGFGTASKGIQGIASTAGADPATQLAAIANSGWASSGYGGAAHLVSLMNQVTGGKPLVLPKGVAGDPLTTLAGSAPKAIPNVKQAQVPTGLFTRLQGLESARNALVGGTGTDPVEQGWKNLQGLIQSNHSTVDQPQPDTTSAQVTKKPSTATLMKPSSTSLKGVVVNSGVNISTGNTGTIAQRLAELGRRMGVSIHVISGYRTPEHSVAVGGFADDPHTKGLALDIGVNGNLRASASQLTNAQLASVGLWRPFDQHGEDPNEINHIQLIGTS